MSLRLSPFIGNRNVSETINFFNSGIKKINIKSQPLLWKADSDEANIAVLCILDLNGFIK